MFVDLSLPKLGARGLNSWGIKDKKDHDHTTWNKSGLELLHFSTTRGSIFCVPGAAQYEEAQKVIFAQAKGQYLDHEMATPYISRCLGLHT